MAIRSLGVLAAFALISSCATQSKIESPRTLEEARASVKGALITELSDRPLLSGVLRTWVRVGATATSGEKVELLIPYMTEEQELPEIGSRCDIDYHLGDIDGIVGHRKESLTGVKVVDDFGCRARL